MFHFLLSPWWISGWVIYSIVGCHIVDAYISFESKTPKRDKIIVMVTQSIGGFIVWPIVSLIVLLIAFDKE